VDHQAVVVDAGGPPLEQRRHDGDVMLLRRGGDRLAGRARHGLRQLEQLRVLDLAEVRRGEQLGEDDDLGAARGGVRDGRAGLRDVGGLVGAHRHLDQAERDGVRRHAPKLAGWRDAH